MEIGEIGQIGFTNGLAHAMENDKELSKQVHAAWFKYMTCDWGILGDDDKQMNDSAVKNKNDRILARYNTKAGDIYIITEWDRSYTTFMFCNEY